MFGSVVGRIGEQMEKWDDEMLKAVRGAFIEVMAQMILETRGIKHEIIRD